MLQRQTLSFALLDPSSVTGIYRDYGSVLAVSQKVLLDLTQLGSIYYLCSYPKGRHLFSMFKNRIFRKEFEPKVNELKVNRGNYGRSQRLRSLRQEPSSPARTLRSLVRFPHEAWISVYVYSVFVLFCVYAAALRRTDLPSKGSYRLYIWLRKWKSGQSP
jgi:hypothetical protein